MATPPTLDPAKLPLDVFDLTSTGLEVESLVAGHGMPETGASVTLPNWCWMCSCGGADPVRPV